MLWVQNQKNILNKGFKLNSNKNSSITPKTAFSLKLVSNYRIIPFIPQSIKIPASKTEKLS